MCLVAGLAALALLYRRIQSIAWITVCLWNDTLLTVVIVIGSGMANFSAARAFDFPPDAFKFTTGFFLGLGRRRASGSTITWATTMSVTSATRFENRDEPFRSPFC